MSTSLAEPTETPLIPFEPPRPRPMQATASLLRVIAQGRGDLLSLLPAKAYRVETGWLGWSRRSILIVNRPDLVKHVLADPDGIFPKNDLMTGAVEPLIGDSIFVSSGETWRRQRAMVAPAFSQLRVTDAFAAMEESVSGWEERLDALAGAGEPFSLDLAMSSLTADIICRTVFSTSLANETARDVFDDFKVFERHAAHVEVWRLIFEKPFQTIPQHDHVLEACRRIRRHLKALVAPHLAEGAAFADIAADVIAARDATGTRFTEEELIDQLGVFFLAGHETTASALIWVFFILATRPELMARLRAEIDHVAGEGPIGFDQIRALGLARRIFREALRLYPPITFLPRVALEPAQIGRHRVRRGAMVMIAPWSVHRHRDNWRDANRFDPERFSAEREKEIPQGAYIPFGLGPRVCVGANFAAIESALILARLARRYDFEALAPGRVRPVARLTTRPAEEVMMRVRRR